MQILSSIKILINSGEWGSRQLFFCVCKLTRGYWRGLEKPEDLCTLPYHQGAHIPSNSLGPASHLKEETNPGEHDEATYVYHNKSVILVLVLSTTYILQHLWLERNAQILTESTQDSLHVRCKPTEYIGPQMSIL
jgi:hypothetical protein